MVIHDCTPILKLLLQSSVEAQHTTSPSTTPKRRGVPLRERWGMKLCMSLLRPAPSGSQTLRGGREGACGQGVVGEAVGYASSPLFCVYCNL